MRNLRPAGILTPDDTRMALVCSKRWQSYTAQLGLLAVASAAPLDPTAWPAEDHQEVVAWARGEVPEEPMPAVLADYLKGVREGTAAPRQR